MPPAHRFVSDDRPTVADMLAPPARPVRSRRAAGFPADLEAIIHPGGDTLYALATGEVVTGAEAIAFLSRRRRHPVWVLTASTADLSRLVTAAGGDYEGYVSESRRYLVTGRMSDHLVVQAHVTALRLPNSDRRAIVTGTDAIAEVEGLRESDPPLARIPALRRFALDYLEWCESIDEPPRPSRGSWGSRFLRDARFFPSRRRKVPRRFNQAARPQLPGNHYELYEGGEHGRVQEIDQTSAHHQSAARVAFADPDDLVACGAWQADSPDDRLYLRPTDRAYAGVLERFGLLRLRLRCPPVAAGEITLPWWPRGGGETTAWVYSAELDLVREMGAEVVGLVGAIVSRTSCDGLNRYAAWALAQLREASPYRRGWLKAVLLATYGVLAQGERVPSRLSSRPMPASRPEIVIVAGQPFEAHVSRARFGAEPGYADVIARGQIEAETRAETIRKAIALAAETGAGRVLALYADSVLFAPAPAIPQEEVGGMLVPVVYRDGEHAEWWARNRTPQLVERLAPRAEWRVKEHTNLRFFLPDTPVHWASDQAAKLPGIPRGEQSAYAQALATSVERRDRRMAAVAGYGRDPG